MSNKLFLLPWKTAWEDERSFIMTLRPHAALKLPITVDASVAISSSDQLPFVTSGSVSCYFRSSQEPLIIC